MSPSLQPASADSAFFAAIAGHFDHLEQVLSDRFTYRTSGNTILDKRSLIRYLRTEPLRVLAPDILDIKIATSDRTSVHRGTVRMQVQDSAGDKTLTTGFLHVWVHTDNGWQLAYRETTSLGT